MDSLQNKTDLTNTNNNIDYPNNFNTQSTKSIPNFNQGQGEKPKSIIAIIILTIILILSISFNIILLILNNKKPKCKSGYFLPNDDKKTCYKCEIPNCETCKGTTNNQICISCINNYQPEYINNNIIAKCFIQIPDTTFSTIPDTSQKTSTVPSTFVIEPNSTIPISSTIPKTNSPQDSSTYSVESTIPISSTTPDIPISTISSINIDTPTTIYTENICGENCEICKNEENRCLKCNSGYYLPNDIDSKLICEKCSIENCEECQGSKNENFCNKCKVNYISIYDDNDKKLIKQCDLPCEIGEDEKCLTCNDTENKCSSCNPLYILVKGKCLANFNIKA